MALPPELQALAAEVSNWGRWGDDDERGTVNLIDAAAVAGRGAARTGVPSRWPSGSTSNGPQLGNIPGRINPLHVMVGINTPYSGDPADFCASDDAMTLGAPGVHALGRPRPRELRGQLYNGFDAATITAEREPRCGIHRIPTS